MRRRGASGVLHRDIKPANILVNRFGMVGLSDFGLASIVSAHGEQTASREALTPAFSSPETFRGEEPTVLADVYSLAATLYTLLSGRPPRFAADGRPPSFATIMTLHDKPVEDVPGTPPELMALLRAGLSPDPAARPQNAAALRDALADPRGPVPAAPPAPVRPVGAPAWDRQESTPTWDPQESAPTRDRQESVPRHDDRLITSARQWLAPGRLGLAAGLMVILVAALITASRFLPHGASPGAGTGGTSAGTRTGGAVNAADVFGIATRSAGCPAAALRVAAARCPATPECFAGLTVISGAASAAPLSCDQPHYWETFAIAILPPDVRTFYQPTVAADPTVRMVCSGRVMLASRHGLARRVPAPDWDIEVLPPTEAAFDSGSHVYRCIANEIGHEPSTSQFGR